MKRNELIIAIVIICVLLLTSVLIYLFILRSKDISNDGTSDLNSESRNYQEEDGNTSIFQCDVSGSTVDYSTNISLDTPIPSETRISGVAEDGSNVKLILRVKTPGTFTAGKDFGMSYQNFDEDFDYNEIYSPLSSSKINLNLIQYSDDVIEAEFSGELFDGSNNQINITNCKVYYLR